MQERGPSYVKKGNFCLPTPPTPGSREAPDALHPARVLGAFAGVICQTLIHELSELLIEHKDPGSPPDAKGILNRVWAPRLRGFHRPRELFTSRAK